MDKYFDNILFFLQKSGGGSVYWGELMKRFLSSDPQHSFFIQPCAKTSNIILPDLHLQPVLFEKKLPLKVLRYLPLTVNISNDSIFHSSYYRYSNQKSVSNFVTVHDFIYEYYRSGIARLVHKKQKAAAIHKAKGIVCISESTRKDLLKFYPSFPTKKIKVIYNGVSDDFSILNEVELLEFEYYQFFKESKYLLYIGHRSSYKNFDFAVELVSDLPGNYKLAIVGNVLEETEYEMLEKKLKDRYLFLGNVSNQQLNKIYNLAFCLLYPSSYEGFGIPILEAYRSGCPVIAQNVSAIPEIAGHNSFLVNGLDIKVFKKKILELQSTNLRSEFIKFGYERSMSFSWNRCFNELNDFYEHNQ